MLANRKTKEKDGIDQLLDQIGFHGMTAEEIEKCINHNDSNIRNSA